MKILLFLPIWMVNKGESQFKLTRITPDTIKENHIVITFNSETDAF